MFDAMQVSSDFATLDIDLPFAIVYVAQSGTELLVGILIMSSVTWQVLIVAILIAVAGYYIKVDAMASLSLFLLLSQHKHKNEEGN